MASSRAACVLLACLVLAGAAEHAGPASRQLLGSPGWGSCDKTGGCPRVKMTFLLTFTATPKPIEDDELESACEALKKEAMGEGSDGGDSWTSYRIPDMVPHWWKHNESESGIDYPSGECNETNIVYWRSQHVYRTTIRAIEKMLQEHGDKYEGGRGYNSYNSGPLELSWTGSFFSAYFSSAMRLPEVFMVNPGPPNHGQTIKIVAHLISKGEWEQGDEDVVNEMREIENEWDDVVQGYQNEGLLLKMLGFENTTIYNDAAVSSENATMVPYEDQSYYGIRFNRPRGYRMHWQECLRERWYHHRITATVTGAAEASVLLLLETFLGFFRTGSGILASEDCQYITTLSNWALQLGAMAVKGSAIVLVGTELMGLDYEEAKELWWQLVVADVISSVATVYTWLVYNGTAITEYDEKLNPVWFKNKPSGLFFNAPLVVSPLLVVLQRVWKEGSRPDPPPEGLEAEFDRIGGSGGPPPPPGGLGGEFDNIGGSGGRRSAGVPSLQLAIELPSADLVDSAVIALGESSSAVHQALLSRLAVLGQAGSVPSGVKLVVHGVVRFNEQGQPEFTSWTPSADADSEQNSSTQTILILAIVLAGLVVLVAGLVVGALLYLWKTGKRPAAEAPTEEPTSNVGIWMNPVHNGSRTDDSSAPVS